MKVVKNKTPKEEVKFTNVFGDEYIPEEHELDFLFVDECPNEEEIESLKEDVAWLAEDILDHEDVLHILWEKIQTIEDDQLQDIKNLSSVVDILECLQEANKLMLDTIVSQNEQNKILKDEIDRVDNAWLYLFRFLVIWNIILSVLFALSICDVL